MPLARNLSILIACPSGGVLNLEALLDIETVPLCPFLPTNLLHLDSLELSTFGCTLDIGSIEVASLRHVKFSGLHFSAALNTFLSRCSENLETFTWRSTELEDQPAPTVPFIFPRLRTIELASYTAVPAVELQFWTAPIVTELTMEVTHLFVELETVLSGVLFPSLRTFTLNVMMTEVDPIWNFLIEHHTITRLNLRVGYYCPEFFERMDSTAAGEGTGLGLMQNLEIISLTFSHVYKAKNLFPLMRSIVSKVPNLSFVLGSRENLYVPTPWRRLAKELHLRISVFSATMSHVQV